jgi:hypothetical protein
MTTSRAAQKKALEPFGPDDMTPESPAPDKQGLEELSFEELMEVSQFTVADVDEFQPVDKETLVNRPMFILAWTFKDGDYGPESEYAFVAVRSTDGLGWFTDGGTGIKDQLRRYQAKLEKDGVWEDFKNGKLGGLRVPNGLRVSNYTYTDEDGTEKPGHTFYINNKV